MLQNSTADYFQLSSHCVSENTEASPLLPLEKYKYLFSPPDENLITFENSSPNQICSEIYEWSVSLHNIFGLTLKSRRSFYSYLKHQFLVHKSFIIEICFMLNNLCIYFWIVLIFYLSPKNQTNYANDYWSDSRIKNIFYIILLFKVSDYWMM